jgi:MoaA/NifB/PqqE/SkfB family radical SAM enzyme
MTSEYKNRCPMPFGAIHYSMAGIVGICPFIVTNKDTITINEYRKDPFLQELREQHLRDERPKRCNACYYLEDMGLGSERKDKTNHFDEDVYYKNEIQHAEVRFSNLCNSKCRICYDGVSSRIAYENKIWDKSLNDEYKIHRTPGPYEGFVLDQIKEHAHTLRRITFSGGEPLLHWQHWELLDFFIENGLKPKLNYYSNVSQLTFKDQHIFDKWKHFDEIDFRMSVDAADEGHSYWRHGTDWNDVVNNIKLIKESNLPVKRTYITTVSWPIIYKWDDMLNQLYAIDPEGIYNNTVVYSKEYTLHVLPQNEKEKAAEFLRNIKVKAWHDKGDIDGMINYMFSKDWSHLMPVAINHLIKLDIRRKESFLDTFPEWTDMMAQYGYNKDNWTKDFKEDHSVDLSLYSETGINI